MTGIRGRLEDALDWREDRLLIGELVLRLQYSARGDWELGEECLAFFKHRRTVERYDAYFGGRPDFVPRRIVELGIWDGGSVAFWFEYFDPERLVAVDLQRRADRPYFARWAARRAGDRVRTHWATDQADRSRLREIVATEHDGELDLVIDDASHLYAETLSSFETLFPLLRPGGLFVIEDWNWGHWPDHYDLGPVPLTRLACELVEALGTSSGPIAGIDVRPDFLVVERGPEALGTDGSFRLDERIRRRPRWHRAAGWWRRLRR